MDRSQASRERLNLAAVQQADTFCKEILDSSSSCALYKFDQLKNSWEKLEFEGVFHLCKRSLVPFYCFVVVNIKNKVNWRQLITRNTKIQIQAPFVLYKTDDDNSGGPVKSGTMLQTIESKGIFGLWFSNPEDCKRVASRLAQIIEEVGGSLGRGLNNPQPDVVQRTSMSAFHQVPQKTAPPVSIPSNSAPQPAGKNVDILQMLNTAQTKFQDQLQSQSASSAAVRQPISVENLFQAVTGQRQTVQPAAAPAPAATGSNPLIDMQDATDLLKRMMGVSQAPAAAADDTVDGEEVLMTPAQLLSGTTGSGSEDSPPRVDREPPTSMKGSGDTPAIQNVQNRTLSKDQLKDALIEMFEDEEFLDQLHNAYVRSVQRRLKLM